MSKKHRTSRQSSQRPAAAAPVAERAEKANPAFSSITIFNDVPQPHTMPRNYKSFADQGFASNDTVFKCVTYITSNGAAIPPRLYTDRTMETEIPAHPLLDRLARPNNEQDGVTFREAVLGWYLIAGNAFLYAIRPGGNGAKTSGSPDELWVLDPNKVKPLPSPTRGIVGYNFDDFESAQNPIPAANIGHLRTWNPKDPIFGISPIEVAALMVDQQTAARKWNLGLLQNMAKPSGAWVTEVALGKPERDRLEEAINQKLTGARNAGRVPVLDAGATWVPTGMAPSELDWLKSLQYNAGQIANLYNIPPQLIGDTSASTYNNMEQAKAASYTEAIFPALDKLYSLLTMWLVPMYPDLAGAFLYYDKATVEVVQNVIQAQASAQADRAVKAYMAGAITLNQAQEMQGLPDLGPKGDVYRVGLVLVPADKLDVYANQSLTEPAKPPKPEPETPLGLPPVEPSPAAEPPAEPPAKRARPRRRKSAGDASDTGQTFLVWQCDPDACDFCLQNDGAVVAEGDAFPNGATGPDDSHPYCKCTATQVVLPGVALDTDEDGATIASVDGVPLGDGAPASSDVTLPNGDSLPRGTTLTDDGVLLPDGTLLHADGVTLPSGATLTTDGEVHTPSGRVVAAGSARASGLLSAADVAALALLTVGTLASRHASDVAAQQAQDDEDDDEADDSSDVTYAAPAKPKPKPKKRKASRESYRQFMEGVL